MKKLLVIALAMFGMIGCDNGGKARPFYGLNGTYQLTGRFCDNVAGSLACVQAVEPIACAGKNLPAHFVIDLFGESIQIHNSTSPMTYQGSQVTVGNSGESFEIKAGLLYDKVIVGFAPGCDMEFSRRHL